MNKERAIQLIRKGLYAEREQAVKTVGKGYELIRKMRNGQPVTTNLTLEQVIEKVNEKEQQIKAIDNELTDLEFNLAYGTFDIITE